MSRVESIPGVFECKMCTTLSWHWVSNVSNPLFFDWEIGDPEKYSWIKANMDYCYSCKSFDYGA